MLRISTIDSEVLSPQLETYRIYARMRRWSFHRLYRIIKTPIFILAAILLTFWFYIYNYQPHFPDELYKSFFGKPDTFIISPPIQPRLLQSRPDIYDIGILMIVSEDVDLSEYQLAIDTMECYAQLHNYGFNIEWVNSTWEDICGQKEFMFIRHCISSHLLNRHEWTLFLDADVAVVNPNRLIDAFVAESKDEADIIFFDRFFDWEIAAGSYLAKNTTYSKEFLMKFAQTEFTLPKSFHGSDNGAIHWLFVQEFFGNHTSQLNPNDCHAIWSISKDFDDLFVYEACCRLIFGEARLFQDPQGKGIVKLIPKGEGWMRDGWITDSKWSPDSDFMLHGWKHSIQMPTESQANAWYRASFRLKFGHWWPAIANPADLKTCSSNITWNWWNSLMISKFELEELLFKKRIKVRKEFFDFQALIPKYLSRIHQ